MKRTEIKSIPDYFDRYINMVEDIDLFEAFEKSMREINQLDTRLIEKIGDKTYLPNKWFLEYKIFGFV